MMADLLQDVYKRQLLVCLFLLGELFFNACERHFLDMIRGKVTDDESLEELEAAI